MTHIAASRTYREQSLFEVCALPGCSYPVTQLGEVCPGCQSAFGMMLRVVSGPARDHDELAAELHERDRVVLDRYRERTATAPAAHQADGEPEQRRNQVCWLCEKRRTCTRQPTGWECRTCTAVTG